MMNNLYGILGDTTKKSDGSGADQSMFGKISGLSYETEKMSDINILEK